MSLERKFQVLLQALIVGGLVYLVTITIAIIVVGNTAEDASNAIAQANAERAARVDTVSQVIRLECDTNNGQDKLLARLIQASIASSGTSFGENVDPSTLTAFDRAVLATIAKVAASGDDADLTDKFRRVLAKLRDLTPCDSIVASYLAGDPLTIDADPPNGSEASANAVGNAIRRGLRK